LVLIACLALASAAHAAERRIALVIGNSAYQQAPLVNPGNDARAVAQALRESGFTVTELRNLNQAGMRRAIREFGDQLVKGGSGLFYYAGHGMQIRGRNFLIPVGSDIQREDEVEDQAVDARLVLEKMETAKNPLNIVILDACRNNPFLSSFRSATLGLAAMDAPAGTLVAFSTAPGQVAADGANDNGLYTKHLVSYMREPGLKVEDVFKRVRAAVRQESGGKQTPWENTSLEADFYFKQLDQRVVAEQNKEREQAQKEAIEKAVQDALKRSREQTGADRAAIERQVAERVAVERAAAEKEAAVRIAAVERSAQEAIDRALRAAQQAPGKPSAGQPAAKSPEKQEPIRLAVAAPTVAAAGLGAAIPPKVGDTWTYHRTLRDYSKKTESKFTQRVEAVTGSEIRVRFGAKGLLVTNLDWNPLSLLTNDGTKREYSPMQPIFSFPLEAGKTWSQKYRFSRSDGHQADHDATVTAVGWENVTVPAGTFKALKISAVSWYRNLKGGTGRFVVNHWYVPEVKRPVKSELLDTGNNLVVHHDETLELLAFKVR
jgi:uncharacterized caspase-like protein